MHATRMSWRVGRLLLARAAVVACCASTTACDEANTLTAPTSSAQLDGTWRLTQMTGGGTTHAEPASAGRFNVMFASGRLHAKADCNACMGGATLAGETLTVGPLACTRAFCASAPLDSQFAGLLDGALTVRVDTTRLHLASPRGELRFER